MSQPESASNHPHAPLLVTVAEAAELLGIGRSKLYELIGEGLIRTVHIGRARRVPVAALNDFVGSLQAAAGCPRHRADTLQLRRRPS